MKVLNYTSSYFAVILLIIITVWSGLFYYAMLDEIYDSIDDGLDNQKGLILQKLSVDERLLQKTSFDEGDYAIAEISAEKAKGFRDVYSDTLMYMQNEKEFEPVRLLKTAFRHNGRYYEMQVINSMVEEDDLTSELFYALLWLYLGLIASILILNNVLLRRIWRPFYHLLKQLKNFRLEKPSIEVQQTSIDEFRLLNDAVQKLLQNNIDSYNSQKHFIENAAHELQTPLAISINKLEALAETGKLREEEMELLGSALNNLERLTRLNKSLLLLSKIENRQFLAEKKISFNEEIKKIAADFADQLLYSKLRLNIEEKASLSVQMNPDLAIVLITNLLKNAMVHNHPGGQINIQINSSSFSIENTSRQEALSEQLLFTRFYKARQSGTSTGLGLSIVKAVADLYRFKISYQYNGLHCITLDFSS